MNDTITSQAEEISQLQISLKETKQILGEKSQYLTFLSQLMN